MSGDGQSQYAPRRSPEVASLDLTRLSPYRYYWMDVRVSPGIGYAAMRFSLRKARVVCFVGLAIGLLGAQAPAAPALQTLYSFNSNPKNPQGGLVQGRDGDFYGTTSLGGTLGEGTVFKITTLGLLTSLFSFSGADGSRPQASLIQGTDRNLYGTTAFGGANGDGAIFKITTNGVFTLLFSFNGASGRNPVAGLVQGADGSFYGAAQSGGTNSENGTLFRIRSNGVFTALFSFPSNGRSGSGPGGTLVQGTDGVLYGTTVSGGAITNHGTVFKITTNGVFTLLFSFNGTNGSGPAAGLAQGNDGNFYGTTQFGGAHDNGTVFRITPAGVLTTLYSFGGPDGNYPVSPMVRGTNGSFYGTTSGDRPFGGTNTFGTVFRMTPAGALTTLIVFGGTNGASPVAGLTRGTDNNFYGTTFEDGAGGGGTIFRVVEPPTITRITVSGGNATLIWTSFSNGMYRVEYKPTLSTPGWSGLFPDVIATGNTASITDQLNGATQRFYRVRLLP